MPWKNIEDKRAYERSPERKARMLKSKPARAKRRAELRKEKPEQYRGYNIKDRYGITYEEAQAMKAKGCMICKKKNIRLCIDHKHGTKIARGCLCTNCNAALGMIEESPALAIELYNYIVNKCSGESYGTRKET